MHALLAMLQHGAGDIRIYPAVDDVEQRMQGSIGVPNGKDRVVREIVRLVDIMIQPAILSVHIRIYARIDHGVIQRGVQHRQLVARAGSFDNGQFLIPGFTGTSRQLVETIAGGFSPQIFQSAVGADSRKGDFHFQFLGSRRIEIKISDDLASAYIREVFFHIEFAVSAPVIDFCFFLASVMSDRFGERHGKVGIVGTRPSVRDTIARDQRIVFNPDIRPKDFSVVIVDTVDHIQDDPLVPGIFRERIFMHANPLGCRQLCFHAVVGQHHFIVAGTGYLRIVRETRTVAAVRVGCRSGIQFQFAGSRHNQDIAEVGMSGSAKMRMAEPDDTTVLMLIAGTIFISTRLILAIHVMRDRVCVRTQLNQSERHASPRKRMPHPVRPDNRVHPCGLILGGQAPKGQQCRK